MQGEILHTENRVIKYMRSEKWAMLTFMFITIPLIIHTQNLMLRITGFEFDLFPYDEQLYALLFALGIDLAMVTFAVNGREKQATGLAFIVFLFNAIFFNYDYLFSIASITDTLVQVTIRVSVSLLVAGTAAWIVHSYVTFFMERIKDREKMWDLYGKIETLERSNLNGTKVLNERIVLMEKTVSELEEKLKASEDEKEELSARLILLQELTAKQPGVKCEYCEREFETEHRLNGHLAHCKKRPGYQEKEETLVQNEAA